MVHRQEIENQFRKFESALKRLEEVLLIVFEFFILHIINLMLTKTSFF
jgi:IS4 transposase